MLYYCRVELNEEHKMMFWSHAFSYIQATNKTTKCKKESSVERNCIFFLLHCLSQNLSNTWSVTWQDHHPEMRCLTVYVSVTSCLLMLRNTAKITVRVSWKIILGFIFILLGCFSGGILMPVKWLTAFTVNFFLVLGWLVFCCDFFFFSNNLSIFWKSQNVYKKI